MRVKHRITRFSVWDDIADHPHFQDNPAGLRIYLGIIGLCVRYGRIPTMRSIRNRFSRTESDEIALTLLLRERAIVYSYSEDTVTINHTFGISGRRLFWADFESNADHSRVKSKRRPIDVKLRFSVFRRDGFRCVYCGATPGEAGLHADHVTPVAAGGKNEIGNLVTACRDCNLGKSDTLLEEPLQ